MERFIRPFVYTANTMRSIAVLVGVLSALILAVPAVGQSESAPDLSLDSDLVATESMMAFLNDENGNMTDDKNATDENATIPDNESKGADEPEDAAKAELETVIPVTSSMAEFLGVPDPTEQPEFTKLSEASDENEMVEDEIPAEPVTQETIIPLTSSMAAFLGVPDPIEQPKFTKLSEASDENVTAENETAPMVTTEIVVTSSIAAFLGVPYEVEQPAFKKGVMS